ncbi:MAG: hypothetical protein P4L87_05585 [Formivibrio sp.]|nr:hypothetical protein [Formivibrio sp.]
MIEIKQCQAMVMNPSWNLIHSSWLIAEFALQFSGDSGDDDKQM